MPLSVVLYIELTSKVRVHNTLMTLFSSTLTRDHILIFYKIV